MVDLLAISHASVLRINRRIYCELRARGWSVEIAVPDRYTTPAGESVPEPPAPDDPPIHMLPLRGTKIRFWRFPTLTALLQKIRPRFVLLDGEPDSILAVLIGLALRRHGGKLIVQSCENLPQRFFGDLFAGRPARAARDLALRLFLALARPHIAHVLPISSDGVRLMESLGFAGRITKTPLGYDQRLFFPDEKKRAEVRQRLGLDQATVAYFGRPQPSKGIHLLVEALAGLSHVPFQFLLDSFSLYRSPYSLEIEALLQSTGVAARTVRFDATHEEMPDYMNATDIVAMPSITTPDWAEQYGRVAPEAMACGRTVVASDSGALPEVVADAGIVVPENNPAALRAALEKALTQPALREDYGRRAARRAVEELSVPRQCDVLERLLRNLN